MKGPGQEAATCQMTALVQCTSAHPSSGPSPGRVLLMVLAATISARLLLAARHPQYCLLGSVGVSTLDIDTVMKTHHIVELNLC